MQKSELCKVCTSCGESKPISGFHKESRSKDGYRKQCKECRCSKATQWYHDNQERQLERHRTYVATNRDRVRQVDNARYERNKDKRIELATTAVHIRRARMADAGWDRTVTRSTLRKRLGDDCYYCGVSMTFQRIKRGDIRPSNLGTVEHVMPVSKGGAHTFDNCVLACWSCNSSKGNRLLDDLTVDGINQGVSDT